jgi:hypothetical protein
MASSIDGKIDGSALRNNEIASFFDGVAPSHQTAVRLKLKCVEQREGDALWIATKSSEASDHAPRLVRFVGALSV